MTKEFEIARLHIVSAARNGEIDRVRGYAWAHRIYPFQPYELEEAFENDFKIGRAQSDQILKLVDDGWLAKKPISFYDIESALNHPDRMEIYHVCRLAFLDGRFDDSVWHALTVPGSGPIETQGMTDEFDVDDDLGF